MALSLQDVQHDVEHDSSPDDHDLIKGDESLVDDIDLSHHEKENGHSMNHFPDGLDHEHLDGVEDGHEMDHDEQDDQVEEQEAHDSDSDPSQEHNENSHNHEHEHEIHNQGHSLGALNTINGMTSINSMGTMNMNNINMSNMSGMHSDHDQYMLPHPNLLPSFPMLLNPQSGPLNMSMLAPQQMMGRQFNTPMLSMQQQMALNSQPNNIQLEHYVPNTEHVVTGVVVGTLDSASHDSDDDGSSKSNRKQQRWRPTQEQRHILDAIWQSNPYPDTQMKQQIVKQFNGSVSYQQVTSWFKHKREKEAKNKFQYKYVPAAKFSTEQVQVLEQAFIGDPYAKGKALQEVSDQLGVPLKRVQNWFKHKRSRLAQQGKFEYKPRNMLDPEQVTFLRGAFFTNPTPAPEICDNISAELGLKPEQVTRWFSNERSRRRKKEQQKQQHREHHPTSKPNKHHNNTQIEPSMQQINVGGMQHINMANNMNSINTMNMAHMNAMNQMNMGGMPNPNYAMNGMNPMQVNQSVNMGAINNLSHMNGLNMPMNMNNINAMAMQSSQHPQTYQFDGVSMHNIANMNTMQMAHMNNMNNLGMAVPDSLDVEYQTQMNTNTPTTTTSSKKKRGRKSKNRMIPIEQPLMALPDDGVNQQHEQDVQDAEAVVGLPADLVHENMVTVGLQIDPQGK